jgi:hypothetical protein
VFCLRSFHQNYNLQLWGFISNVLCDLLPRKGKHLRQQTAAHRTEKASFNYLHFETHANFNARIFTFWANNVRRTQALKRSGTEDLHYFPRAYSKTVFCMKSHEASVTVGVWLTKVKTVENYRVSFCLSADRSSSDGQQSTADTE